MGDEVVIEGNGTGDEMEARLITELKRHGLLEQGLIDRMVVIDQEPPKDERGHYRIRITTG